MSVNRNGGGYAIYSFLVTGSTVGHPLQLDFTPNVAFIDSANISHAGIEFSMEIAAQYPE